MRRAFGGVDLGALDPFVHLDQMGEVDYAPGEPKGTPWHPHRGFETVTYMIDGIIEHHDSTGGGGRITDGDTQWMTAGSGLLHIETPPDALVASGGVFHGLQLWVNLPRAQKWIDPQYQEIAAGAVTLLASDDGGALVRLIAGDVAGNHGPGSTHSPITMIHATIQPGARLVTPVAGRVQRARLHPRRRGHGRRRTPTDPLGSARGASATATRSRSRPPRTRTRAPPRSRC